MKNPPTMRDVAAKAGVTPTVVSRVLHNKAISVRVSEATAVRVREAARDLGYRVNVAARNFRERQTGMIGVLHGINFDRPVFGRGSRYFASLMDGVVDGAFRHGVAVTLCPKLMGQTPEDAMSDGRFDGLIWYSTVPSEQNAAMLRACTSPLVLVHAQTEAFGRSFPNVACDNAQGVALALDHLAELGHRRIAFAQQGDLEFSESNLRRDAFLEGMAARGLPVSKEDVIRTDYEGRGVEEYLARGPGHTAVIAHNEELAAAFVRVSEGHGLRVPHDLSVVGFDSTSFCNEVRPALTAVSQPLQAMGACAVDLLMARIAGAPTESIILPCGLDVRESTGRVKA